MNELLVAMALIWFLCAVSITSSLARYFTRLIAQELYLMKAPDCCMCGADYPGQCGNHTYTSQKDYYRENLGKVEFI